MSAIRIQWKDKQHCSADQLIQSSQSIFLVGSHLSAIFSLSLACFVGPWNQPFMLQCLQHIIKISGLDGPIF